MCSWRTIGEFCAALTLPLMACWCCLAHSGVCGRTRKPLHTYTVLAHAADLSLRYELPSAPCHAALPIALRAQTAVECGPFVIPCSC